MLQLRTDWTYNKELPDESRQSRASWVPVRQHPNSSPLGTLLNPARLEFILLGRNSGQQ